MYIAIIKQLYCYWKVNNSFLICENIHLKNNRFIYLNFSSDSIIRIYDRRFLALVDFSVPGSPSDRHTIPVKAFTIPSYEKRPFRVTSVNFSQDESELLVSYSSEHLYLFNINKEVRSQASSTYFQLTNLFKNSINFTGY